MIDTTKSAPLFKVGDRVRILHSPFDRARIIEYRGPLGPGGRHIYRVRIPNKPKPRHIELREDQLVLLPARPKAEPEPQEKTETQAE